MAMKRIIILIFAAFLTIFAVNFFSCKKEKKIYILSDGKRTCEYMVYHAKIGNDLETALDSLIKLNAVIINNKDYYIKKEDITANVDFNRDDRLFYLIHFINARISREPPYEFGLFSSIDVLDSYGNYYNKIHCPD